MSDFTWLENGSMRCLLVSAAFPLPHESPATLADIEAALAERGLVVIPGSARLTARVAELEQEATELEGMLHNKALDSARIASELTDQLEAAEKRVEELSAELASCRKVVEAAREVSDAVDEYQGEDDELFQLIREKCEARWVAVALEELQLALASAGKDSGESKTIGKDGAGSAGAATREDAVGAPEGSPSLSSAQPAPSAPASAGEVLALVHARIPGKRLGVGAPLPRYYQESLGKDGAGRENDRPTAADVGESASQGGQPAPSTPAIAGEGCRHYFVHEGDKCFCAKCDEPWGGEESAQTEAASVAPSTPNLSALPWRHDGTGMIWDSDGYVVANRLGLADADLIVARCNAPEPAARADLIDWQHWAFDLVAEHSLPGEPVTDDSVLRDRIAAAVKGPAATVPRGEVEAIRDELTKAGETP